MFKVNNKVSRVTPLASFFIANFEHFTPCSSISIVNFAKENVGWVWAA